MRRLNALPPPGGEGEVESVEAHRRFSCRAAQRAVVPLVHRVQRHDRKLAQQLKDATNSFVLNLGEGAYSDPGTRRSR